MPTARRRPPPIPYLLDPRIVPGTRWITGADAPGKHVFDLVAGRDFVADGTIEAAEVRAATLPPTASGRSNSRAAWRSATSSSWAASTPRRSTSRCWTRTASSSVVTMGSYGIGVTRAVALLAENNHDELGLTWPIQVAPYHVHVVATGKEPAVFEAGEELGIGLEAAASRCCYDDRPKVSPGVKFKDAELVGAPYILVVGRGLENGTVEFKNRASGESAEIAVGDVRDRGGAGRARGVWRVSLVGRRGGVRGFPLPLLG